LRLGVVVVAIISSLFDVKDFDADRLAIGIDIGLFG
jgi:hypothetical protein